MMRIAKSRRKRGQAIVEFALILPILLILSMLIVQYGIIMYTMIGLTNLARETARYTATQPDLRDDDIKDVIVGMSPSSITISRSNISISPPFGSPGRERGTRQHITALVTYNLGQKMFLPTTFFGVTVFNTNYVAKAVMMVE